MRPNFHAAERCKNHYNVRCNFPNQIIRTTRINTRCDVGNLYVVRCIQLWVWLVCLRPMGCHLLNFFEISGRGFRSSAAKFPSKDNMGKLQRRPVFVSAFHAPVRRCAGKNSFFAPIFLTLMKLWKIRHHPTSL